MAKNYHGRLGTQCAGKIKHWTLDKANKRAEKLSTKYGRPMRGYYCGICNGYHVGGQST